MKLTFDVALMLREKKNIWRGTLGHKQNLDIVK